MYNIPPPPSHQHQSHSRKGLSDGRQTWIYYPTVIYNFRNDYDNVQKKRVFEERYLTLLKYVLYCMPRDNLTISQSI